MSQNLGDLLREAGIKNTGPLKGPLRPSMEHRIIISRLRREIKEEKENGKSSMPVGPSVSVDESASHEA